VKIAYVTPRYGVEVFGGAEHAVRMVSERLIRVADIDVEILTTCADDTTTWANAYPPGPATVNGVAVRRFASQAGRAPGFDELSRRVLLGPPPSIEDQERWVMMQGPVNPDLVAAAEASDADVVTFTPYLYYPTLYGLPRCGRRGLLHPAAHDEPAIRLPIMRSLFESAPGVVFNMPSERRLTEQLFNVSGARQVVFNMPSERRLTEQLFNVSGARQLVLGWGVDSLPGDVERGRRALGLVDDRPYLACVGRVDASKGTSMLARFFDAYRARHRDPVALVFLGQVIDPPPVADGIVCPGIVSEQLKWDVLSGATALLQPSPYESFSFSLLEGWAAGLPALVNGACAATREHCQRSGGGLWFDGYGQFEVALELLCTEGPLRARLARRGQEYVERFYRWPSIIDRYANFLRAAARHV
jgi:glycosyltransferase involved in cell wall biosynthesis